MEAGNAERLAFDPPSSGTADAALLGDPYRWMVVVPFAPASDAAQGHSLDSFTYLHPDFPQGLLRISHE